MDGWLKGLIAAACVVIIAGVSYYFWQEFEAARREAQRAALLQERERRQQLQARIEKLRPQCDGLVDRVLTINEETPIKSTTDIPAAIRDDVATCVRMVPLSAYNEHGLQYTGLIKLWR